VLNGEKIYVTSGARSDAVVVWATLDKSMGRAAIKSFVVPKDLPGIRVDRVEHKLGIRSSDTATIILDNCRVPKENLLGNPDIDAGFAGAMQTFDNTRPLVAAMAVGCARAALELTREMLTGAGVSIDHDRPAQLQVAAAATFLAMEADWEAAYLMTLQAAWLADNSRPNSVQASMAKAKAGRVGNEITLRCVGLTEPWATARTRCWRSGHATPRSSTSSRARNRSSSSSSPAGYSGSPPVSSSRLQRHDRAATAVARRRVRGDPPPEAIAPTGHAGHRCGAS